MSKAGTNTMLRIPHPNQKIFWKKNILKNVPTEMLPLIEKSQEYEEDNIAKSKNNKRFNMKSLKEHRRKKKMSWSAT